MHINWLKREIIFKIVYYGPGLSGKTTNVEYLYRHLAADIRGELISLKTTEERTLYFDFMQLELGKIKGKKPRFHIYTTPGQLRYGESRRIVLQEADAVIFVADSQRARIDDNLLSLMDLEQKLIQERKTLADFPWVLQYNKRDLPQAETINALEKRLNFLNIPYFEAVATRGEGVFETLRHAIQLAVQHVV